MKNPGLILIMCIVLLTACGRTAHEHSHDAVSGDSSNAALNTIIMSKHDEVMPKLGTIYKLKKKLQDSIAHAPGLAADKKAEFETLIGSLDSASNSMMAWMHGYDPNKDSADQEKNRAYLENEIEKINQVGEQTTEVIEKATSAIKH